MRMMTVWCATGSLWEIYRPSLGCFRMRKKILPITGLLILLPACAKKQEAPAEAPAPVQVTAVTQNTIRRTVSGDGTLFPLDQANVMPKLTAPVQKFYVNRSEER